MISSTCPGDDRKDTATEVLVDNHARAIVKSIEDPFVVVAWPRLCTATLGVLEMKKG